MDAEDGMGFIVVVVVVLVGCSGLGILTNCGLAAFFNYYSSLFS